MRKYIFTVIILCGLLSVTLYAGNSQKKQIKMVSVKNNSIVSAFAVKSDNSIDLKRFAEHYALHPERWNDAFRFLSEQNLKELPLGRIDISDDVYAAVSEYTTKDSEDALFESHKKYIDLQYIISGQEYIGLTNDHNIPVSSPYNAEKDIAFYNYSGGKMLKATPVSYFIFFPEDYHRPCIKIDEKSIVKKIVIKIRL